MPFPTKAHPIPYNLKNREGGHGKPSKKAPIAIKTSKIC
jgi:hypothetical protein